MLVARFNNIPNPSVVNMIPTPLDMNKDVDLLLLYPWYTPLPPINGLLRMQLLGSARNASDKMISSEASRWAIIRGDVTVTKLTHVHGRARRNTWYESALAAP